MKFGKMTPPSVLQDAIDLGLAIARDLDSDTVARYESMMLQHNAKIVRDMEEQSRYAKIQSMLQDAESDDSDETMVAFSEDSEMNFHRTSLFLEMLQTTAGAGIDPVSSERFNECFK